MTDAATSPRAGRKPLNPVPVWAWVLIGIVALTAAAGFYLVAGTIATVPDVVGRTSAEAGIELSAARLSLGPVTKVETSAPSGRVLAQSPLPGTLGRTGDPVALTVAAPLSTSAPSVVGLSTEAARSSATAAGLTFAALESFDASATSGTVIAQAPDPGTTLVKGAVVAVLVSKGPMPAPAPVPSVVGKREIDADAVLTLAGFRPVMRDGTAAAVASGSVIGQLPAAGQKAAPGSTVEVLVSRGTTTAASAAVPKLTGKTRADAVGALTVAGFVGRTVLVSDSTAAAGTVSAQVPAADSRAVKGADVIIAVSTGKGAGGVAVPRLTGTTSAAAQIAIEALGLTFKSVSSVSASIPAGEVIAQVPSPRTLLLPGSPVLCVVSSGPPS